jgi:hypothetical protein
MKSYYLLEAIFLITVGVLALAVVFDWTDRAYQAARRRREDREIFGEEAGDFRLRGDSALRQQHWRTVRPTKPTFTQKLGAIRRGWRPKDP